MLLDSFELMATVIMFSFGALAALESKYKIAATIMCKD
jgi:hypothetical protein